MENWIIFCENALVLCTFVYIGMGVLFLCTKNHFSIFGVPIIGFFVKDLANSCCKIGPNHFSKILGHI